LACDGTLRIFELNPDESTEGWVCKESLDIIPQVKDVE